MKLTGSRHHYLGIAIGERSITVAEVAPRHGVSAAAPGVPAWEVRRAAEFILPAPPEGASDDAAAAAIGAVLAKFLRDNGFGGAGRAVVGVPARWLVARERELPPTSPDQANEILRLQAERMFSAELGELTVDYAGQADANNARGVLLVAMPNKQLRRVVSIVEAAGKQVTAVMPSTLALADAVAAANANDNHDGIVLSLSGDAVELSAHRAGSPKVLRHLPVRGPDLASSNGTRESAMSMLAGEIRRTVAMMPRGVPAGPAGIAPRSAEGLHVWDGIGLDAQDAATLAQQAGVDLRGGTGATALSALGVASSAGGSEARFAPALALALSGATRRPGAVDFLHPRLAEPKKQLIGRREGWAIFIGLACLLALGALYWDVKRTESAIAEIRTNLDAQAPLLQDATLTAAHVGTARGWFHGGRPPVLECLRDITSQFPDGGEAIYFTKLTLPENRQGRATGKAPNRDLVYDLIDHMNASKIFQGAKSDYTLEAGGQSSEVAFSISFTYVGGGGGSGNNANANPAAKSSAAAAPAAANAARK